MKVSQDPLNLPSIGLMHMMAVKGKKRLLAHGTAVSCTQKKMDFGEIQSVCFLFYRTDRKSSKSKLRKQTCIHKHKQRTFVKWKQMLGQGIMLSIGLFRVHLSVVLPLQFYCRYHHAFLMQAFTVWKWRRNVIWGSQKKHNFIIYVQKTAYTFYCNNNTNNSKLTELNQYIKCMFFLC